MSRILYLSYDGALDPLGRSQVVPYLERLAREGFELDLLTFEKPRRWRDASDRADMRARLSAAGIRWHPLGYHKRPPVAGTLWDLWRGRRLARSLVEARRIELIHARSYPPALIALSLHRRFGVPWVFDMRGLYAEERVDGGLWPEGGWLYRRTKRLEAEFLRHAAAVVTLTRASEPLVSELMRTAGSSAPLETIPTCVDLGLFRPPPEPEGPPPHPPTLAYVGSVGTWYLLDEMLDLGRVFTEEVEGGRVLFLTNEGSDEVRGAAAGAGLSPDRFDARSVPHGQVPEALAPASATFFLIAPGGSKRASMPTKFAESLALGLPVAANRGVGDCARIVEEEGVGVVVESLDEAGFRRAAREIGALAADPGVRARCRRVAQERFALERGARAYAELYRRVLSPAAGAPT